MSFYYLHGLGGSRADWSEIQKLLPGVAIPIPSTGSLKDAVLAIADQMAGKAGAVLCGYSMGGRIAILVAEELKKRGESLRGLALLSTGLGFSTEAERADRLLIDEKWAFLAKSDGKKFWQDWYAQPLFASFASLPSDKRERWLDGRKSIDFSVLENQFRRFSPAMHPYLFDTLASLLRAKISVLYLAGERDKKYLTTGKMLEKELGVKLAVIPLAGHILTIEAPEMVEYQLSKFFPSAQ
ncbi:MAG: alpha/beta fold hydrolase [Bdellovibrionota bacterium]